MRLLLTTTAFGVIAAATASPAIADTVVSTAITTPVATSSAGNVEITSTGSVKPPSGVAVTINSNNSVDNKGAIGITGANNSAGIVANPNVAGNITNSGTITIDENYTPTDTDNDGDLDGPFAQGSNRYGIRVLGGGTFTGNIANSGAILVEGNQSGGIAVDSALVGSLSNSANITVIGDNSVGIRLSDVSGNVTLSKGDISVQGANAVGVALGGNIGGALVIQGKVQTTGYRYTSPPADTSKLDADDLLQNGSAVVVSGNVGGGILFDARPADNDPNDNDEDDDGIPDAQESTATIVSFGSAAAVKIGSEATDISVGAVASSADGHGVVVKGSITGAGVYSGVAANGMVIGGTGHAVDVAGGMTVTGSIAARANGASATGVRIGSGASVPAIHVSGSISAEGGGPAASSAQALVIDQGANVSTIKNSGSIVARRVGTDGTAAAIVDKSGTLTLIENRGSIGVVDAAALGDKAIAFDLRANTSGVTVNQVAVTSGKAPSIAGTMLFGSGNDVFSIAAGTVTGTARFDSGDNRLSLAGGAVMNGAVHFGAGADIVELGGTSSLTGNIHFGGGADQLKLSGSARYTGQLSGSAGTAVDLGAGTSLNLANVGVVDLASLSTGAGSTLGVTVNTSTGASTLLNVAGTASFGADTRIDVRLLNLAGVVGTYKIVEAGSIVGSSNLSSTAASLPLLFASSLNVSTPNEVSLVIRRKTAAELDLNSSEASILDAVIGAADSDSPIAAVFLGVAGNGELRDTLQQMLPEHSGGSFEIATRGSRLTGRTLADPGSMARLGSLGLWAQQVAWTSSKSTGSTSSYSLAGWGAAGGIETELGALGSVGMSLSYLAGRNRRGRGSDNELMNHQYEGGAYWRGRFGGLTGFARATASMLEFDGSRHFSGTVNGAPIQRQARGEWKGRLYSGLAGLSYDARLGGISLRPAATIEHYSLSEDGYTETGGGSAFNLIVDKRKSDETAATGSLAIGYGLFGTPAEGNWMRVELEGGRRQILSGSLGATTARFEGGDPFTLAPEGRTNGWLGGLRLLGGGSAALVAAEVNAEQQHEKLSIGGRLSLQLAM